LFEVETQLIIAKHVGYVSGDELFESLDEARRALDGYIGFVRKH
jgi:hypothetical protein